MDDPLNIMVFGVFALLILSAAAILVMLGALPGNIARQRGHPQADAVTAAGWIGLATGILWPLAFIWAFYRPSASSETQTSHPKEAQP
jgi:hypothetical protein